jgi:hypothetical protein
VARGLTIALVAGALAFIPVATTACSGGGDSATGPSSSTSACNDASFDSSAGIAFNLGCSSVSVSVSGITYDSFSRRTSYNYDMSCSNGTNRKTGRVYNITYNNLGQALTWDFTVNGTTCRKG